MVRLAVLTAAAVLTFGSTSQAQSSITFAQAYEIAQKAAKPKLLLKGRTERKVYGFYFYGSGKIREIEVSKGGEITKNVETDLGKDGIAGVSLDVIRLIEKQANSKAKLPEGRILEIAAESLKDTPLADLTFSKDGDALVVKSGDIVINARTGKVTSGDKKK
ncbi:MAG TPA: hypothetical protein VGJ05_04895 [Fimbriiglobus sp.]|jgi:hypothetical protein